MDGMNVIDDFDRTVPSSLDRRAVSHDLDMPTDELRVVTSGLAGREAAISAGHHALARLVTTRQVTADR